MRTKLALVVAALLLVAVSAFIFSQPTRAHAGPKGDDEQAVRQLVNELAVAVGRNDVAALDRIYADRFTFVSDTGAILSKAQRLAALKSGEMRYESVSFDEVDVRLYGGTAVATFRVTSKGQSNGQGFSGLFRVTATFVKVKGRWQEVAAQSTPITGR
jgi:ketosteroid isomerase-like protein